MVATHVIISSYCRLLELEKLTRSEFFHQTLTAKLSTLVA